MAARKIPEDVFRDRCRWCIQGRTDNGNREIPEEHLYSCSHHDTLPCNIMSISQCNKVPGECLSFHPNWIYGICGTCRWSNQFHEGFCLHPDGAENKRVVYLGTNHSPDDYWTHYRSTCDRYQVKQSLKDLILRDVLRGKSPANFDPDTWEPLDQLEGSAVAEEWLRMQAQEREAAQSAERKAEEARQAARDQIQEEQISLF